MVDDYGPHNPMPVLRDAAGHVQPPLDQGWDDLTKLQWRAGVSLIDSGIRVAIATNCYSQRRFGFFGPQRFRRDLYGLNIGNASYMAYTIDRAWVFLTGLDAGVEQGSAKLVEKEIA